MAPNSPTYCLDLDVAVLWSGPWNATLIYTVVLVEVSGLLPWTIGSHTLTPPANMPLKSDAPLPRAQGTLLFDNSGRANYRPPVEGTFALMLLATPVVDFPKFPPLSSHLVRSQNFSVHRCVGCDGVKNSGKVVDACGVCGGDGLSCAGCDGVPHSRVIVDACGVCGGMNKTCAGCDGIPFSGLLFDSCGNCNGTDNSCLMPFALTLPPYPNELDNRNFVDPELRHFCTEEPFIVRWIGPSNHTATTTFVILKFNTAGIVEAAPPQFIPLGSSSGMFNVTFSRELRDARFYAAICDQVSPTSLGCSSVLASTPPFLVRVCTGCDGKSNSHLILDSCGVCGGSDQTCGNPYQMTIRPSWCQGEHVIAELSLPSNHSSRDFISIGKVGEAFQNIIEVPPGTRLSLQLTLADPRERMQTGDWVAIYTAFAKSSPRDGYTAATARFNVTQVVADDCGVCSGDGRSCAGCDGVSNSGKVVDQCGVCGGNNACVGCDGKLYSGKKIDGCGVCGGNNSTCGGCDGVPYSRAKPDNCGLCEGPGGCELPFLVSPPQSICFGQPLSFQWSAPTNHSAFTVAIFRTDSTSTKFGVVMTCRIKAAPVHERPVNNTALILARSGICNWSTPNTMCSCVTSLQRDSPGMHQAKVSIANKWIPVSPEFAIGAPADECGVCGGDNSACMGCDKGPTFSMKIVFSKCLTFLPSVLHSGLVFDKCGVCNGTNACVGCDGVPNSKVRMDACGVCGGDNSTCSGCDGVPKSGARFDTCGTCKGSDNSCDKPFSIWTNGPHCASQLMTVSWYGPSNNTGLKTWEFQVDVSAGDGSATYVPIIGESTRLSIGSVSFNLSTTMESFAGKYRVVLLNGTTSDVLANSSAFAIATGEETDVCNVCKGNGKSCLGCDGVPNSGKVCLPMLCSSPSSESRV